MNGSEWLADVIPTSKTLLFKYEELTAVSDLTLQALEHVLNFIHMDGPTVLLVYYQRKAKHTLQPYQVRGLL